MRFTITSTIACTPNTFWERVYFDPEYVEKLYRDALGCKDVEIVEQEGTPGRLLHRRLRSEQAIDAPGPVKKLFGDAISYTEEGTYDPTTGRWVFVLQPSRMADKLKIKGEMWLDDIGERSSTRHLEMDVGVKILGVGGVVEKFIEKQTRDTQTKEVAFTNAWVAEHGLH